MASQAKTIVKVVVAVMFAYTQTQLYRLSNPTRRALWLQQSVRHCAGMVEELVVSPHDLDAPRQQYPLPQVPLQHWRPDLHWLPLGRQPVMSAAALCVSPKQASAMPASPSPNCFSAARRVTDCVIALVSSSNLLFM